MNDILINAVNIRKNKKSLNIVRNNLGTKFGCTFIIIHCCIINTYINEIFLKLKNHFDIKHLNIIRNTKENGDNEKTIKR